MSAAAEGYAAPTERDAHWGPGAGPGAAGLYQGESRWQQGWGQGSRYYQWLPSWHSDCAAGSVVASMSVSGIMTSFSVFVWAA